ncbi:hypothetical protein CDAR_605921 [Caerostris darwini]|uniref:Uncharacterized protein n=1 Tax=Caerostris darwini TaxID=1538125 RepID=A0AAV4QPG8_9ARAC|nr:hypothetical protein CDAR_605921 [Caerostris darwini]
MPPGRRKSLHFHHFVGHEGFPPAVREFYLESSIQLKCLEERFHPTATDLSTVFAEFIMLSRDAPSMLNSVNNQGEMLVNQFLKMIGDDSPRPVVEFMSDILTALRSILIIYVDGCDLFPGKKDFRLPETLNAKKEDFVRTVLT